MSPDPVFWYGLVLKMAMTATIVVTASVVAERTGPFIAALIAALPTAAGATYIILALEHPPRRNLDNLRRVGFRVTRRFLQLAQIPHDCIPTGERLSD